MFIDETLKHFYNGDTMKTSYQALFLRKIGNESQLIILFYFSPGVTIYKNIKLLDYFLVYLTLYNEMDDINLRIIEVYFISLLCNVNQLLD